MILTEDIQGQYEIKVNDIFNIYEMFKDRKFYYIENKKRFYTDILNEFFKEPDINKIFTDNIYFNKLKNQFIRLQKYLVKDKDRKVLSDIFKNFINYMLFIDKHYKDFKKYHEEHPEEWKDIIKNRSKKIKESIDKIKKILREMEYYNKIKSIQEKLYGKKVDKWTRFFSENTIRKYIKNNGKNIFKESFDKDDYLKIKNDPELKNWLELKKMWNEGELTDRQKEKIKKAEKMLDMWGDTTEHLEKLRTNIIHIIDDVFNNKE